MSSEEDQILSPEDGLKSEDNETVKEDVDDDYSDEDGWIDVVHPLHCGNLRRRVLEKGHSYKIPETAGVTFTYTTDDESVTVSAMLGYGFLPQGLEMLLPRMEVNELDEVFLSDSFAFKSWNMGDVVLRNGRSFTLKIEHVDVHAEKDGFVELAHKRGNNCFKADDFNKAMQMYHFCLSVKSYDGIPKVSANLLACYLHIADYEEALCFSKIMLDDERIVDTNIRVKLHYRRGQAFFYKKLYDEAIEQFKIVLELDPQNKAAELCIHNAEAKIIQDEDRRHKMFKGMAQCLKHPKRQAAPAPTRKIFPVIIGISVAVVVVAFGLYYQDHISPLMSYKPT